MSNLSTLIASELSLKRSSVDNALELLIEGATIPFIARYRKEKTGSLDEIQLREIWEKYQYLTELEKRKTTIIESIKSQGKLTEELQAKITNCFNKTELEDLYLPYKPKRRTRGTIAKEKGLEPLAQWIKSLNTPDTKGQSLIHEAEKYRSEEHKLSTIEDVLQGASDILAEEVADQATLRSAIRDYLFQEGVFISKIKKDYAEGTTKYEMYRSFSRAVSKIVPHNFLALLRGESEKILTFDIDFDLNWVLNYLDIQEINTQETQIKTFYQGMLKDAFNRLIKPALIREIRSDRKQWADRESIKTFEVNLRELLLSPPAGMKPTLAIDPGFRTGCKVAILSETGQFLHYQAIFPHSGDKKRQEAATTLAKLMTDYQIQLIAIGNGTASRETEQFVAEVSQNLHQKPIKVIVNESGASIYSASDLARQEFPDLDVTVRGAISIGRRLQDPLAELVKIEPKSLGVGQYQHDVDQKLLKGKLEETVESCVNYVGVDLNTASAKLLTFVSGITPTLANNIVSYRDQNGIFKSRQQLLKVKKLGAKAFEQCAGFLRIRNGENPLDNTAVHPESYAVVEKIAQQLKVNLTKINQAQSQLKSLDLTPFVTDTIGIPTLKDVIQELEKPGRDPREQFTYATFKEGINEISDLEEGMILEGIITNVVNFGAFVDIGVHQDGLIHISQLSHSFVNDPKEIVKVGQVVTVKVMDIDEKLRRVSLSIKAVN
ncbi:MAG: Tex family protein [Microcystaceae cyanobacterium]